MTDVGTIIQFLWEGDLLGFFQAIYVSAFQNADLFWAFLVMLFTMPLYVRTRSLVLLCIAWILVGSVVVAAMPIAGGLAVFLLIFGFAGVFWRLYRMARP